MVDDSLIAPAGFSLDKHSTGRLALVGVFVGHLPALLRAVVEQDAPLRVEGEAVDLLVAADPVVDARPHGILFLPNDACTIVERCAA